MKTLLLSLMLLAVPSVYADGITPVMFGAVDWSGGLTSIFAGNGSAISSVDVLSPLEVVSPQYVDLNSLGLTDSLLFSNPFGIVSANNVVLAYITKIIGYCGGVIGGIGGCAEEPGNRMILTAGNLNSTYGLDLFGHELGHDLGLDHWPAPGNLMNASLWSTGPNLTASQIAQLSLSSLIVGGVVTIEPVFIEDTELPLPTTTVPEPSSFVLLLIGLGGIYELRRCGVRRIR